jgi:hypothetical protein
LGGKMIITKVDDKNYIVKIYFDKDEDFLFNSNEDILDFFKIIFGKLIRKYKIRGEVIVNFYLDEEFGIILDIYNSYSYGNDINTKIIFHLDCKFLIEVDYFQYIGNGKYLYYYKDKFYAEALKDCIYDGDIIYDSEDIINNGIVVFL